MSFGCHWSIAETCMHEKTCRDRECQCVESRCRDICGTMGFDGTCDTTAPYSFNLSRTLCHCICDDPACETYCDATGGSSGECQGGMTGSFCVCDDCDDDLCYEFCRDTFAPVYGDWGTYWCARWGDGELCECTVSPPSDPHIEPPPDVLDVTCDPALDIEDAADLPTDPDELDAEEVEP